MEERGIRKVKLTSEMKNSFMQYAMSVIVLEHYLMFVMV